MAVIISNIALFFSIIAMITIPLQLKLDLYYANINWNNMRLHYHLHYTLDISDIASLLEKQPRRQRARRRNSTSPSYVCSYIQSSYNINDKQLHTLDPLHGLFLPSRLSTSTSLSPKHMTIEMTNLTFGDDLLPTFRELQQLN